MDRSKAIPARTAISPGRTWRRWKACSIREAAWPSCPAPARAPPPPTSRPPPPHPERPIAASAASPMVDDADSLCTDFMVQPVTTLPEGAAAGATNIKVAGVAGFAAGQTVMIGSGPDSESAIIASVGTAGSTRASAATQVGMPSFPSRPPAVLSWANRSPSRAAPIRKPRLSRRAGRPWRCPDHRDGATQDGASVRCAAGGERHHADGAAHPRASRAAVVTTDLPTPGAANNGPTRGWPGNLDRSAVMLNVSRPLYRIARSCRRRDVRGGTSPCRPPLPRRLNSSAIR